MSTVTTPSRPQPPGSAGAPILQGEFVAPPRSQRKGRSTTRARHLESLAIFLLFGAAYTVLGYEVMIGQHVVVFDALDRLARAFLVWHDAPPKLAAIGFDLPPVSTLALLPAAAIKPLATSLVGLVMSSAVFAAGVIVLLNRVLARCEMSAPMRYPVLILFGANPLFAFYASNGMSEMVYLFFLAATLYALLSWFTVHTTRFLILAGLALSVCMLARYEFVIWAVPLTLMVGGLLIRQNARRSQVEGTVVVFAAPFCYALALWTLFNGLIVQAPFRWVGDGSGSLAINSDQIGNAGAASLHLVVTDLSQIVASTAPLAFAVVPVLMLMFFARRDEMSLWLAGLVALAIVIIGADALLEDRISVLVLSNGLTIALAAVFGAAWIFRSVNGARLPVWLVMLALLGATLPLAWDRMQTYPFQNQEQAFVRALKTGEDQEGTSSIGGFHVGIAPELRMADFINRTVTERHAILTDNAQSYAAILFSGRPQLFFDRVQRGDGDWMAVRDRPYGHVGYMLIATQAKGDLLRQRYSAAANGADPNFPTVFRTSRYALVRVPPHAPAITSVSGSVLPSVTSLVPGTAPAATTPTAPAATPGTAYP